MDGPLDGPLEKELAHSISGRYGRHWQPREDVSRHPLDPTTAFGVSRTKRGYIVLSTAINASRT